MELHQETKKKNLVSVFSLNGSGVYFLFVDKAPPSKHDLLVSDYIGVFVSSEAAMTWYDQQFLPYGEPQALIARFDGNTLNVILRSIVLGEEDGMRGHPAWTHAYDMDDDSGEDW